MGRRRGGVKSSRRRDEGTRPNRLKGLPLFPDPSSHRRGNTLIGSIPAARPLVCVYLHTCAKLIKAELIQVLVIFQGCFVLFFSSFFLSKMTVFNFTV